RHAMQALQSIGSTATPRLLVQLKQQVPQPLRIHIIEVLRSIGDPQAVVSLLPLLADPSLSVQQQAANALISAAPTSIRGLIDFVNTYPDEAVAGRAMEALIAIGSAVVVPVTQQLFPIVPGRTRLLVEVLENVPDPRAIPALISLLQVQHGEPLLTVAGIRALSHIPDQLVVPPLLGMLERPQAQIYEEAISALGRLSEVALPDILMTLETQEDPVTLERLRRAILCMVPFPGEQLIEALAVGSDVLAEQLMLILGEEGAEAAQVLVYHLLDTDDRLNGYIHQTLASMPGPIVVPALLEVLDRPSWNRVVSGLLLNYPEAIPPLIHLLSDPERDTPAASILPQFGPDILLPLLSGLSDYHPDAQKQAERVIVALVRQRPEVLEQVVQCFGVPLSPIAREVLLDALTNLLVDVSLPALLSGLEDAHLVDGVSEALLRLQRTDDGVIGVLDELLQALRETERQWGAETTLVKIGAPAVQPVSTLITDNDLSIATTARRILAHIGAPAFPFIWAASSDTNDLARRDAALSILHQMPATVIQDGLVQHLVSDEPQDVAMALVLLLERIDDEARQEFAMQEMIPALLAHVEEQESERTLLRILALLLFIGGQNVIEHLVQALYEQPDYSELIVRSFLLLGSGAERTLETILEDEATSPELRIAVMGILSMLRPGQSVYESVRNINSYGYGLTPRPEMLNDPEMLAIALSALGGLLVGGHWDVSTLLGMQAQSPEGHPDRDLATALLGWRYGPYIQKLLGDLHAERELHQMEMQNLSIEMDMAQDRIFRLQDDLDRMHHEHTLQVDELDRKHREIRDRLDYREEQRETLDRENERLQREKQYLERETAMLKRENEQLKREIQSLQDV
ncbi:MAG TPA: HEAT repeat domain-containing protein, partial [Ktedonobacteraceae bacterium]|nr:HEAT repeat domain-containing protein [Ktedonobacteraceae bacterium]